MPNWLRWILVLPASLGAFLGIQLGVGILSEFIDLPWLIPKSWENVAQDWFSQGLNSVAAPIALIYAGARTAPRNYRFQTSLALAVLYGVFSVGIIAYSFSSTQQSYPQWWLIVTSIAGIIAVILVCVETQRSGTDNSSSVSEA